MEARVRGGGLEINQDPLRPMWRLVHTCQSPSPDPAIWAGLLVLLDPSCPISRLLDGFTVSSCSPTDTLCQPPISLSTIFFSFKRTFCTNKINLSSRIINTCTAKITKGFKECNLKSMIMVLETTTCIDQ